jgi:predicted nuclease of predicted toxin-antitoxin system
MVIRLYLDEHVRIELVPHLRRHGYDVLTTAEAGRANQGISDESQLQFAAEQGRIILTNNQRDFAPLDAAWKAQGREHAGIILYALMPPGELCRRVEAHLQRYTAEEHYNLLLWC